MSTAFATDLDSRRQRTQAVGPRPGESLAPGDFPRPGDEEQARSEIGAPGFSPLGARARAVSDIDAMPDRTRELVLSRA